MENRERALICPNCGANLEYSPGARALKCLYCRTVTQIEPEPEAAGAASEADKAPTGPEELIVPLSVTKDQLLDSVRQFLASGEYTPDDLVEQAAFKTVEQFYVPAYMYSGGFQALWSASFGFDRTESYTEYERDSDGNTKTVTKTRTVTDWSPASGQDVGTLGVVTYAGSRLKQSALPVVASLVEGCRGLASATRYDAAYTSGMQVEAFTVAEPEAYRDRGEAQVNGVISMSVEAHRQGDRQSDWHWSASIGKQYSKLYVPICHVIYEYENKAYEVWVDGSDATNFVADPSPVDARRQSAVWRGYIPGMAATLWALWVLVVDGISKGMEHPFMLLGFLFMAWRYGVDRRSSILTYSQRLRSAVLAQRRLASAHVAELTETQRAELLAASVRPKRRWLVVTSRDWWLLPLLSVISILCVQVSFMPEKPTASTASQSVTEQTAVAAQASSAQAAVSSDQSVSKPSAVVGADFVALLELATIGQWGKVDELLARMRPDATQPKANRNKRNARRAIAEGEFAIERGDYSAARDAFQQAVQIDPTNVRYLKSQAMALYRNNQQVEALALNQKVLLLAPRDPGAWIDMAANLAETGKTQYAKMALMMALHVSRDRKQTLELLRQQSRDGATVEMRNVSTAVYEMAMSAPAA